MCSLEIEGLVTMTARVNAAKAKTECRPSDDAKRCEFWASLTTKLRCSPFHVADTTLDTPTIGCQKCAKPIVCRCVISDSFVEANGPSKNQLREYGHFQLSTMVGPLSAKCHFNSLTTRAFSIRHPSPPICDEFLFIDVRKGWS